MIRIAAPRCEVMTRRMGSPLRLADVTASLKKLFLSRCAGLLLAERPT
jgi:hypothetical protein